MIAARPTPAEVAAHVADRIAIEELNACFAHALDHAHAEDLGDLFIVDARYVSGSIVLMGRANIVAFFQARQSAGPRTTRHMWSGMRLEFDGALAATGTSVWISYAANVQAPVSEVVPFMVADFEDRYEREADGHWRIAARLIRPVFRNPAAAPLA